jgi:hypothetical protein
MESSGSTEGPSASEPIDAKIAGLGDGRAGRSGASAR